jgi:DNA-binding NtrC family response regulator
VDVRVIAATKRDLWEMVQAGEFREDLYFRLNVVHLQIPPLRRRPEDIPLLAAHFIEKYGRGRAYEIEPGAMERMQAYAWPGNVRELENAIQRAIALAGKSNVLKAEHLLRPVGAGSTAAAPAVGLAPLRDVLAQAEAAHIRAVIAHTGGNRVEAAQILGIAPKTLYAKMRRYEIVD